MTELVLALMFVVAGFVVLFAAVVGAGRRADRERRHRREELDNAFARIHAADRAATEALARIHERNINDGNGP